MLVISAVAFSARRYRSAIVTFDSEQHELATASANAYQAAIRDAGGLRGSKTITVEIDPPTAPPRAAAAGTVAAFYMAEDYHRARSAECTPALLQPCSVCDCDPVIGARVAAHRAISRTAGEHTLLHGRAADDLLATLPHVGAACAARRASAAAQRGILEEAQADAALRAEDASPANSAGKLGGGLAFGDIIAVTSN